MEQPGPSTDSPMVLRTLLGLSPTRDMNHGRLVFHPSQAGDLEAKVLPPWGHGWGQW